MIIYYHAIGLGQRQIRFKRYNVKYEPYRRINNNSNNFFFNY